MLDLLIKFQNMDRRWIFLGMAFAILIPLLFPLKLPFKVNKEVQAIYDAIEEVPKGGTVLLSADFDPASLPELGPFFNAHLHHLFRNDTKVVIVTLWPTAPALIIPEMTKLAAEYGKEYGRDYAYLGFKDGKELAIKTIGANIPQGFPSDYKGTPTGDLPVMKGMRQARDFDLMVAVSAGFPGLNEYVLQIQGQYDLKLVGSCTAVSGPDYIPFYKSGQLIGLAAGMPGSAQYETLVWEDRTPPKHVKLLATAAMDVLNLGHLFIIALIIAGNVAFFITRRVEESA